MIRDLFQLNKMVHLASVLSVFVFFWTTNAQVNENLPIRLTGSDSPNKGLVEVFYQDQWGTICDDEWDMLDGEVICRQLGFESIYKVTTWGKARDQPDKPIHLDNMQCYGYELNIGFCKGVYDNHNCDQTENAGVICTTSVPSSTGKLVRLVNGGSDNRGRVEVYYKVSRVWGTVCDDSWDILDANVVCRQLGFDRALNALSGGMFGNGEGLIVLDDAECDGTESKIQDCYGKWGSTLHNCDHNEDAGVQCGNQDTSPVNDVRLVEGAYPNQGRVEVMLNGDWGTVCDDSWDLSDAQVVCRQLNYGGAYRATFGGTFPDGYGDILLDDLDCVGSEDNLFQCRRTLGDLGLPVHNCQHSEDAGVVCLSDEYPLDAEGFSGTGFGFELSGISAGLFIVIPICFCVVICTICRKWCKGANANSQPTLAEQQAVSNFQYATNNYSNSPAAQQSNQPYSPAMDYHSVPTAPPPLTNIPQPVTAPDMPPGYDSVMEDPNKYGIPPTNGVIPVTPPPAYTPQMVVFNTDTNTVNLNVEEQQYQQNSSNS